jgi:hypothetical protein
MRAQPWQWASWSRRLADGQLGNRPMRKKRMRLSKKYAKKKAWRRWVNLRLPMGQKVGFRSS